MKKKEREKPWEIDEWNICGKDLLGKLFDKCVSSNRTLHIWRIFFSLWSKILNIIFGRIIFS